MLKALYDYGVAHPEIILPPETSMRGIKFVVELTPNGDLVGVRQSKEKAVPCPDIGGATRSGTISNILMEKAELSIRLNSPKSDEASTPNTKAKRECFLSYFEEGAQVGIEAFASVLTALRNPETLLAIQEQAAAQKMKPTDSVGFAINGELLSEMATVRQWWSLRCRGKKKAGKDYLDLITGQPCTPAELHKSIPRSAAGKGKAQASGVKLVSFNHRAFESYGLSEAQGLNAPMSQETADIISDSLTYLGEHGGKLADMRFIHWYDKEVPRECDILLSGFFDPTSDGSEEDAEGIDEEAKAAAATKLVESPITGEPPMELSGCTYHIMLLHSDMSRMSIRYVDTGNYATLYSNLKAWFDDMTLVSRTGQGRAEYRTINGLLYGLLSQSELAHTKYDEKMAALKATVLKLAIACMQNGPIPPVVLARAIANIKSQIYRKDDLSPVPFQVLKMYLLRQPGNQEGGKLMPELNPKVENIGYQCGRLLAIYDAIQRRATPEVQTGVLTKFYAACSQHPAMTIGRMQTLSVHHLRKIESPYYERLYRDMLAAVYDCIPAGTQIPKRLSPEDQAYFAVGYWQQVAEIGRQTYKPQKQEEK